MKPLLDAALKNLAMLEKKSFQPMPPDAMQGGPGGPPPGAGGPPPGDPSMGGGAPMDPSMAGGGPPPGPGGPMDPMAGGGAPPPPDPMSMIAQVISEVVPQVMTQTLGQFFGGQAMQQGQLSQQLQETTARLDELEEAMMGIMQALHGGEGEPGLEGQDGLSPESQDVVGRMMEQPKMAQDNMVKAAKAILTYVKSARKRLQGRR